MSLCMWNLMGGTGRRSEGGRLARLGHGSQWLCSLVQTTAPVWKPSSAVSTLSPGSDNCTLLLPLHFQGWHCPCPSCYSSWGILHYLADFPSLCLYPYKYSLHYFLFSLPPPTTNYYTLCAICFLLGP